MPRFQSRLFNWIDQSLPVSLGRRARRALMDVAASGWRNLSWADWQAWWQKLWFTPQLPRLAGYQVIRGLLMPARVMMNPLKRKYLKRQYLGQNPSAPKALKPDASVQNYLPDPSHQYSQQYLGITPSQIISNESVTEPLLPQYSPFLLSESTADASVTAASVPEIQFYDLWWAKPKSQFGNFLDGGNTADQPSIDNGIKNIDITNHDAQLESPLSLADPSITEPRPPLPPVWLRPLVRFTAWLENTNLKVEREISALTVQVNTALATIPANAAPTPESERLAANRAFAVAFTESLQRSRQPDQTNRTKGNQSQHQGNLSPLANGAIDHVSADVLRDELNALSESNHESGIDSHGTNSDINSDHTASHQWQKWQKIHNLLAAALDYFTGKAARQLRGNGSDKNNGLNPDQTSPQEHLLGDAEEQSSAALESADTKPQNKHQHLKGRKSARNLTAKRPDPQLQGNQAHALSQSLNSFGAIVPDLTEVPILAADGLNRDLVEQDSINSLGNQIDAASLDTPSQPLANQDPLARLSELLNAAAAYFFGKKSQPATNLNGNNAEATSENHLNHVPDLEQLNGNHAPILDSATTEAPWLSLEDVFGSDVGPWPLPTEYDSIALNEKNNLPLPQMANGLAITETTTTQITADRLTAGLAFDEFNQNESGLDPVNFPNSRRPVQSYRQRSLNPERPLRAWIETQAQSLGYVYGPVMSVVHWLDSLTVKVENFFVMCGRNIKRMFRWLIRK